MEGRKIVKLSITIIGVAIIIGYSFFILNDFVRGPRITITSPQNGFSTTTAFIAVSGQSAHTNNLSINDMQTPVDLKGNFHEQLILAPGYNIIKVAAKDNYERTVEKTVEIIFIPPPNAIATSTATTSATSTVSEFQMLNF